MAVHRSDPKTALAGVVAMGAGVALQALLHQVLYEAAIAPVALGQAIIATIPGSVAGPLITLLGHWAMRLLVAGCVALFLAAGLVATIRPRLALPLLVLPWAVSPVGALALPAVSATLVPSLLAAGLAATVAWLLHEVAFTNAPAQIRRRRLVVGGAALIALAMVTVTALARRTEVASRALAGTALQLRRAPTPAPPPSPADDAPAVASAGIDPDLTSNRDFYVVDEAIVKPNVDVDRWRLEVVGLVRQELAITYDELLDLDAVEQYQTLECIGNPVGGPLISSALWTGVPLRIVLERAGLVDGVVKIVARSVEGYSSGIPLDVALRPTTLLAFGMNGHALPREHGFPARLLIPGLYGMKNVKWLARVEATNEDYLGFWEKKGWSDEAIVHSMSRIDIPGSIQDLRAGQPTVIAGIAYCGDRSVSRVEVSLDGGKAWREAQLGRRYSKITWRRWAYPWTPAKGWYQLRVRAWDDRGVLQPQDEQEPLPLGATGFHGYQVEVR